MTDAMCRHPEDRADPVAIVRTTLGELQPGDQIEAFYGLVTIGEPQRAATGWVSLPYRGDDESRVLHAPAWAEMRRVRRPGEGVPDAPGGAV